MKIVIYYEVRHGNGVIQKNGENSFETSESAIEMAKEFKENPRTHNQNMSDENVEYWKNQTYEIVKITLTTESVVII